MKTTMNRKYIYIYMYVCVCVCIYAHTHTHIFQSVLQSSPFINLHIHSIFSETAILRFPLSATIYNVTLMETMFRNGKFYIFSLRWSSGTSEKSPGVLTTPTTIRIVFYSEYGSSGLLRNVMQATRHPTPQYNKLLDTS
jgi:hypothetical protein